MSKGTSLTHHRGKAARLAVFLNTPACQLQRLAPRTPRPTLPTRSRAALYTGLTAERISVRRLTHRCKLTSPYLSVSDIDDFVSAIGTNAKKMKNKPRHQPTYQMSLGQFLEALVRISLLRQKNWQKVRVQCCGAL